MTTQNTNEKVEITKVELYYLVKQLSILQRAVRHSQPNFHFMQRIVDVTLEDLLNIVESLDKEVKDNG